MRKSREKTWFRGGAARSERLAVNCDGSKPSFEERFSEYYIIMDLYLFNLLNQYALKWNWLDSLAIFSAEYLGYFLVIIIAGLLFGIGGMLVAVPGYTAIKVVAKEFLSEYKIVQSLTKNL